MLRGLALLLVAALVAGCAASPPPARQPQVRQTVTPAGYKACDDGGSGGVMIDGVCL